MPQYQGIWTLQQQAQALTSGQWVTDPLFDQTTLLLQGDNAANASQNNTFLDTSSNAFAITRNGNTTQGSFTPFSQAPGYWSNYFTGLDFLRATASSLSNSQFTCEAWIYFTGTANQQCVWDLAGGVGGYGTYVHINSSTGNFQANFSSNNTGTTIGTIAYPYAGFFNTWVHLATSFDGSTYRFFVNGTLAGTISSSTVTTAISTITVGGRSDATQTSGYGWVGYISNFRYVTGAALYTASFTPTTAALGIASSGTTRVLTCQSNRFVDNSSSPYTLTIGNGSQSVQAFSPFAPQYQYTTPVIGGSGYFDGTGDYLSIADNAAFTMGTGDFTIEYWGYMPSYVNGRAYGQVDSVPNLNTISFFGGVDGSNKAYSGARSGTTEYACISTNNFPLNQWVHHALVRNGTTLRQYINGVQDGTSAIGAASVNDSAYQLAIGRAGEYNALYWLGYISSLRIVKGACLYPNGTTFTPPTSPFTTTVSAGTVSLLTNFTNAGIYDGTMKNNLETVGNAQISTAVVKYGSGSLYFDGSGDSLSTPSSPSFQFGNGDFTVEGWVNFASVAGEKGLVSYYSVATYGSGFTLRLSNGNSPAGFRFVASNNASGGDVILQAAWVPVINTWYHFAVVRSGNVVTAYINGVAIGSTAMTITIAVPSAPLVIGTTQTVASSDLNGYIDDLRITKGFARYLQNFTPPQAALPRQ